MPSFKERAPAERESLIFSGREQAERFIEHVGERLTRAGTSGIKRDREKVAEAVADEFAAEGEAVSVIKQPWDHTPEEHRETQALINTAFSQDLGAAIKQARRSRYYPRIIDLMHDILTNELYEAVNEFRVNRQGTGVWFIFIMLVLMIASLAALLVLLLSR